MLEFSILAGVAELVYAHDLKSCLARDVGSTPTPGTVFFKKSFKCYSKIKNLKMKIVMRP